MKSGCEIIGSSYRKQCQGFIFERSRFMRDWCTIKCIRFINKCASVNMLFGYVSRRLRQSLLYVLDESLPSVKSKFKGEKSHFNLQNIPYFYFHFQGGMLSEN